MTRLNKAGQGEVRKDIAGSKPSGTMILSYGNKRGSMGHWTRSEVHAYEDGYHMHLTGILGGTWLIVSPPARPPVVRDPANGSTMGQMGEYNSKWH